MDREKNIPAIFVTPVGMSERKRSEIIFLHSATGHRESFLGEAMSLAEKELEMWRSAASELSAWTDFLLTRREVDPEMIFFVGKNLGGGVGGFWLASEERVRGAVFSGAIPDQSIFWTESSHPVAVEARRGVPRSNLAAFRRVMSAFGGCH